MRKAISIACFAVLTIAATSPAARADVCVAIDQARDTFSEPDRAASLILVANQFEAEGQHVDAQNCTATYRLSHVKLGDTITITLAGQGGQRQAMAIGMNDVPAVYSQLVRALLTGREVGTLGTVVNRTNVTNAQASPIRVQADSLFYTRLGYGGSVGAKGGPALGFGFRREIDAFAIDASFLNLQGPSNRGGYYDGTGGMGGSWVKLEVLKYGNKKNDRAPYWGGGFSWGSVTSSSYSSSSGSSTHTNGSGLQGELTAGYEILRASNIRMFLQTDVTLPFYSATTTSYTSAPYVPGRVPSPPKMTTSKQYIPSAAVSFGLGWGHSGKARR